MSLLEGHATFVMNSVVRERVPMADAFHQTLHERRTKRGMEKAFQKVIGFDVKVRQYDQGERFVASVVAEVGMERFNRIWESPANLPSLEEIARPERWVARVAAF
jgi:putative hydrolase